MEQNSHLQLGALQLHVYADGDTFNSYHCTIACSRLKYLTEGTVAKFLYDGVSLASW